MFLERRGAHISCLGMGRKQRITPLHEDTATAVRAWIAETTGDSNDPLFTARGTVRPMSTDAVAQRIGLHTTTAAHHCRTLADRHVTPHVLRHTCAMRMLASGIDATTIALWLGHESPESTRPYLNPRELHQTRANVQVAC